MGCGAGAWRRRRPEESALYRVVASAWAVVRERLEAGERPLPRFCAREIDAFLRCGVLAYGFARVWCQACGKDDVVAFSCKGRGFCPSCGARRMADTAAWLVDRVIPEEAPVRQWVLSLPYRLRVLCAYDPDACALVRRVLVRAVSGFYEGRARRLGLPRPRTGAVAFVQRFDSGLRLNLHYHVVWLDGVYSWQPGRSGVAWHEHEGLEDAGVARLVRRVRDRVLRALRRAGKWWEEGDAADADVELDGEQQLLLALASGAVTGRAALGAGEGDVRVGRGTRAEPYVKAPLCADCDGFSLHAGVRVAAGDRRRLEHLLRYAARPAIASSRLSLLPDGRVCYELKRRWKDGSTRVVMTPEVLIERLLALVPRPRRHLVTYHGVLAPAAGLRSRVVPRWDEAEAVAGEAGAPAEQEAGSAAIDALRRRSSVPHAPGHRRRRASGVRRYPWAELLRRVFEVEVLVCPHCGGAQRLLAAIHDPASIERVLRSMGLPHEAPEVAPARGPPGDAEWWGA